MSLMLTDENGNPLDERITGALERVLPRFRRQFPSLSDPAVMDELLETAGRRVLRHEARHGEVQRLHGFTWTILKNVTISYLRGADRLLERNTVGESADGGDVSQLPATRGNPTEVEHAVFYREVLEQLSKEERFILSRRQAGFSSKEIAKALKISSGAVDQIMFRTRQKLKRLLRRERENPQ
jgi:RNA polymerase sigma factor (sigma-70 family)